MPKKAGFEKRQLARHFQKHGRKFPGATDMLAYESLALAFVSSDRPGIEECLRSNGDTVYFDPATGELAVCREDGLIRTYFTATREYFERTCEE